MSKPVHQLGDEVYLKTDPEHQRRMVTGITTRPGYYMYLLTCSTSETSHYEMEITKDRPSGSKAGFK